MRNTEHISLAMQRQLIQQKLQRKRADIVNLIAPRSSQPSHFPRSFTLSVLSGKADVGLVGRFAQQQLAAQCPRLMALSHSLFRLLFRY
ncbi:hypothetical protein [Flavobacterium sp. W21_SRS_FM6]|uniref:hypothetical protein n=1 Tax=Flavobacterium sp. W21_SRS_FM6 TaxID=3240268 RepID=UPI003F8FDB1A